MAFVSNARLEAGSLVVNIGPHQWDFVDGARYLEALHGIGPYGIVFRDKYDITVRHREVRFAKIDSLMDDLRYLAVVAGTRGTAVKFTPDVADLGTFWWLDWPDTASFQRVIENRQEIRVRLQEQSPGA